jgi:hypothetical protein
LGHAAGFGFGDDAAEGGDAVVAAAFVVEFGEGSLAGFDEEALFEHALNGTVEGAGAEFERPPGTGGDVLDDGVAVAVLIGDGEQNVEGGVGEGEQGRRVYIHTSIICMVDILSMGIVSEGGD